MSAVAVAPTAPELADYERAAEAFFTRHGMLRRPAGLRVQGVGSDVVPIFSHDSGGADPAGEVAAARAWRAELADAGYAWIQGPVDYGGAGLTPEHAKAFARVQAGYLTPPQELFMVGAKIVAPTILAYGRDQLRDRYLRSIVRGDLLACQLFSEPGAGSDLAGLSTRAVQVGDEWRVNGAKVWTSQAQLCDVGLLLARTDPDQPKHRGLTLFVVDMHDPAIEIRPLRQMNGSEHFNEVFINDLHVSDLFRVGDPGAGWTATVTTLNNERAATGDRAAADRELIEALLSMARDRGAGPGESRSVLRQRVGRAVCSARAVELLNQRFTAEYDAVGGAGPRNSVVKLARNQMLAHMMAVATTVLGERTVADTGEWGTYAWGQAMLSVPGQRIAGGTDEIQKTILAERVLGMPSEPRPSGTDVRTRR